MATVTLNQALNFAPATEAEEILQNVRMIVSTVRGTVMLNRSFGIDGAALDRPINQAQQAIAADIIAEVARQEPRATVTAVRWDGTAAEGALNPRVEVTING